MLVMLGQMFSVSAIVWLENCSKYFAQFCKTGCTTLVAYSLVVLKRLRADVNLINMENPDPWRF